MTEKTAKRFVLMVTTGLVAISCFCPRTQATLSSSNGPLKDTFRGLFFRIANEHLTVPSVKQLLNSSVEACAELCVKETEFECRSFELDNVHKTCHLHRKNHEDDGVRLEPGTGTDHYRTNYVKQFSRIVNHVITLRHNRKLPSITVEECARSCIYEMAFQCRGFDYDHENTICWLTELDAQSAGGLRQFNGVDCYEKIPVGIRSQFINYGSGRLRNLPGGNVYNQVRLGLSLEECAQLCNDETTFHCLSIDYQFSEHGCYMSEYIAANVYGLETGLVRGVMHFEKIETYLQFFYPTPYAVLLGNNHKKYSGVTPNYCARMCLQEDGFICRSFDYQIRDGTCLISAKTGSDIGGLYNQGMAQIHHFEMKPFLECGGELKETKGTIASPNWPRNYAPHQHCEWRVTVPEHKVVHFTFIHFDLGLQTSETCADHNDRLVFSEILQPGNQTQIYCTQPNTKKWISKTNVVNVTFTSDVVGDAPGFRLFYSAEWPCNAELRQDQGLFASPNFPENYMSSSRCSWHIRAPPRHQILFRIHYFHLEPHPRDICSNRFDYVAVYDGSSNSNKRLGIYCGARAPFSLMSTGSNLLVEFSSDPQGERKGFNATYHFISNYEIPDENPSTRKPSEKLPEVTQTTTKKPDESKIVIQFVPKDEKEIVNPPKSDAVSKTDSQIQEAGGGDMTWIIGVALVALLIAVVILIVVIIYRRRQTRNQDRYLYSGENVTLYRGDSESPYDAPADETAAMQPYGERNENIYESIPELDKKNSFNNPIYGKEKANMANGEPSKGSK
ncbi:uncharacterized protein LOC106150688 isoform X2 [Lingula anatina]|uniref:Uncharacterized protein LOC106150688 isoform X2 n=1 Tax=Lingula anatina TaxID=7574 RepID=A0A1S3GZU4_LINAN|nr:uncharacterized protein LOC106150688 isoform X2 [Lingula anatina]|eukprot:XP_013379197.1 uncharacterized protein LOC106150688 isoform X2 [Lingula anatina]